VPPEITAAGIRVAHLRESAGQGPEMRPFS
jgi:hypothetical protein